MERKKWDSPGKEKENRPRLTEAGTAQGGTTCLIWSGLPRLRGTMIGSSAKGVTSDFRGQQHDGVALYPELLRTLAGGR